MKQRTVAWLWATLAGAAVFPLGIVDWATGYELNFFVFYFAPISIAGWWAGRAAAVSVALLSAVVWFGADSFSRNGYSSHAFAVWNTIIRLLSFLAIGWTVSTIRRALDREHETAETLRKALSEIKTLKTFLPICAECKKIRDEQGVWHRLEQYIGQHTDTRFSHGYCPDCARKAIEEAGLTDRPPESRT